MEPKETFRYMTRRKLKAIYLATLAAIPTKLAGVPEWQQKQVREVILEDMLDRMVDAIMEDIDDIS